MLFQSTKRALAGAALSVLASSLASAQIHPLTTFFGGSEHDRVQGCAVEPNGNILITGNTGSINYGQILPAAAAGYQKTFQGGADAFVAILSPDLSTVVAWTYFGGTTDDRGYGVLADSLGRVWICGFTDSVDLPSTTGVKFKGGKDAFIARFSPDLKQLQMCTMLGGSQEENPRGSFIVDANFNVFISGSTGSLDFPTTPGVFQPVHAAGGAGSWDAFITKLDVSGHIVWSTFLGGSANDAAYSNLRFASDGSIVTAGFTASADFPTTPGAFQTTYGGSAPGAIYLGDGFVARITADGKQLVYSTFLGGSDDESVSANDGLELDDQDDPIVIGVTSSHDFPMVAGGWNPNHTVGASRDGFVATLSADGAHMLASTFIGGVEDEEPAGLDLDSSGNIYISGNTNSKDYPVTADAVQPIYAGSTDAVITKFSPDLVDLLYSTFLGGSGTTDFGDRGRTLVLNTNGKVVISGDTDSPNFPTTPGTCEANYQGGISDGFVTTLSLGNTYVVGKGKKTSQNKFATLAWTGTPSAAAHNFVIQVKNAIPHQRGLMVWGPAITPTPFAAGTLYPEKPVFRLKTQTLDATGFTSYAIPTDITMIGGTRVYQFLFVDPNQPDGTLIGMTNALKAVFTP